MTNYSVAAAQVVKNTLYRVFGWMSAGLMFSAFMAYLVCTSYTLASFFFGNPFVVFGLAFVQIALVIVLSARIEKLSYTQALVIFMAYAGLTGCTLAGLVAGVLATNPWQLVMVLAITTVMFAAMAIYGAVTEHDWSPFGTFGVMVLFGMIALGILNIWFRSAQLDMALGFIGVIVFAGFTAYDIQKIKGWAFALAHDPEMSNKLAVLGALHLYLDFINLFISLLRVFGNRRND